MSVLTSPTLRGPVTYIHNGKVALDCLLSEILVRDATQGDRLGAVVGLVAMDKMAGIVHRNIQVVFGSKGPTRIVLVDVHVRRPGSDTL